jgi:putative toxin-antitoxin system antitoxin component (TIGR02293 family)
MRSLVRYLREGARLNAEVSSRTWKFAEMVAKATSVFGDKHAAEAWMLRPALGLDGKRPFDLLETETGREVVEDFLGRIEYSVYT